MGLWMVVDDEGRAELRPELIAGAIYPGDATMSPGVIERQVLELDESGFLTVYPVAGRTFLQLARPLMTQRPKRSQLPPNPRQVAHPETSGNFLAMGGAGASVGLREQPSAWAEWVDEQERGRRPPERPLLLDAPQIGCPEHPDGRYKDCGPCGTARRRHDKWLAEQRYERAVEQYEGVSGDWDLSPI